MSTTQANLLADTYQMAYDLVRFYTSNLKDVDPHKQWEVNGYKLNSVAWINAHLCWSEDFLLLKATGGKSSEATWLDHYQLGSDGTMHEPEVDMKTILADRKIIHDACMAYIRSLSDEDLAKPNPVGLAFGPQNSINTMIQHAIRHEGTHAGQLGWLCKINGSKTI